MSGVSNRLLRLGSVLWAGSLWSLGLWVTPTLFRLLPERHVAGLVAGNLLRIQAAVTVLLAAICLWRLGLQRARGLYLAALMLVINELIIRWLMDLSKTKGQILGLGFGGWHGVSVTLYLVACLGAVSVVWQDDLR